MKISIKSFLAIGLTFLFTGCVTKTVKEGAYQKAQWQTKAVVKDLKNKKNQTLDIDIFSIKNERARFEISALFGFQVASLVMSPTEISYAIYPQKNFYYGKNSENAFQRMLHLQLHPMNLTNIAFDEPVRGPGWKCSLDSSGWVSQCENVSKSIKVLWGQRDQGQKKVTIEAPGFEMLWSFSAPKTEVEFKPELFVLKQPSGFKAIQIN